MREIFLLIASAFIIIVLAVLLVPFIGRWLAGGMDEDDGLGCARCETIGK